MKVLNILLTISLIIAYFGFDKEVLPYGFLLICLLISEVCEAVNESQD